MTLPAQAEGGKYEVLQRLAVGGMAEIYLARALGIQGFAKYVVLKRILPERACDPRFVEMFLDEARLAALLHHNNIAQVYDIGELQGAYFFTMEYLHGGDMRALFRKLAPVRKRIELQHALTIVAGVAAGLHYAHDLKGPDGKPLGLVHRDISPSNVIVTFAGAVKIVDFGVACATLRASETQPGGFKGKLSYLSPEQCVGAKVDRRSDVFSLGIMLYEMTTMQRLFRRPTREAEFVIMDRIVNGDVLPPSTLCADYPPELEAIVMKALAVDRDERYATAGEMLEELETFAAQERLALSEQALSRYVIELFGHRPEPWLADAEEDGARTIENDCPSEAALEAFLRSQTPASGVRALEAVPEGTVVMAAPAGGPPGAAAGAVAGSGSASGSTDSAAPLRAPSQYESTAGSSATARRPPWLSVAAVALVMMAVGAVVLAFTVPAEDAASANSTSGDEPPMAKTAPDPAPVAATAPDAAPVAAATLDAAPVAAATLDAAPVAAAAPDAAPVAATVLDAAPVTVESKTHAAKGRSKPKTKPRPKRKPKDKPARGTEGLIERDW